MFKNLFLKTLLNMLLLNYKASLSRSDFFKFWVILLLLYSFYVFCGYLAFWLDIFEDKFVFYTYFIEIFILPLLSILLLSLIYKANFYKTCLFYANLFLLPLFTLLLFFGAFHIILIFAIYVIFLIFNNNFTNLQINLNKKELVLRLIAITLCGFIAFKFPPDLKFIKYGYGIDFISILTTFNAVFLAPSFTIILIYLIKNYKRLK